MTETEEEKKPVPLLGTPDRLPKNIMELNHRRIVNPEGQPLIVWNGNVYWFGSGRLIGPVGILKPTCPREYYFCDYCGGTFTQRSSNHDDEMSLSKHFYEQHRDVVVRTMPQPKGFSGGAWTPTDETVKEASEKLAGGVPEAEKKDPALVIQPVESLAAANKRPAKKWRQHGSKEIIEE